MYLNLESENTITGELLTIYEYSVFCNLLFLISLILSESLLINEIIHYKFGNSKDNLLLISLSKYVTASDLKKQNP